VRRASEWVAAAVLSAFLATAFWYALLTPTGVLR
jgi:hypothetical protein